MVIAFCGHSHFERTSSLEATLTNFLISTVGNNSVEFLLGGYGEFDDFAYSVCQKYKKINPRATLIFVTPYQENGYLKKRIGDRGDKYDCVEYPQIEDKLPKFAIKHRNRYMVERADYVIAFVSHKWGGAYNTFVYAEKKGKRIFNLAQIRDLS